MSTRSTGRKGDGYIQVFGGEGQDVGAMEAGSKWEGAKATKCFVESGSLMPKILRDMWWSYMTKCGHSADVLKRLVIPSILIYSKAFRLIELDSIGRYITRIRMNGWKITNLNGGVKPLMDLFLDIFLI
ncbi:hypothetical protein HDU80_009256 [Chytriomyces hyalinus]|nr:hypothetical protein HDU80_009256 [Chytriomyces hyalinus]